MPRTRAFSIALIAISILVYFGWDALQIDLKRDTMADVRGQVTERVQDGDSYILHYHYMFGGELLMDSQEVRPEVFDQYAVGDSIPVWASDEGTIVDWHDLNRNMLLNSGMMSLALMVVLGVLFLPENVLSSDE